MNEQTIAVAAKAAAPDRDQSAGNSKSARDAFTAFVRSLSADDWEHASPNPAWNVRQLMYHTAWSCEQLAGNIPAAKSGKAKGALVPHVLINPASMLITEVGRARRDAVICLRALRTGTRGRSSHALDGIRDDEWHPARRATAPTRRSRTRSRPSSATRPSTSLRCGRDSGANSRIDVIASKRLRRYQRFASSPIFSLARPRIGSPCPGSACSKSNPASLRTDSFA